MQPAAQFHARSPCLRTPECVRVVTTGVAAGRIESGSTVFVALCGRARADQLHAPNVMEISLPIVQQASSELARRCSGTSTVCGPSVEEVIAARVARDHHLEAGQARRRVTNGEHVDIVYLIIGNTIDVFNFHDGESALLLLTPNIDLVAAMGLSSFRHTFTSLFQSASQYRPDRLYQWRSGQETQEELGDR